MDDIDRAQDAAEFLHELALANESGRHATWLAADGRCHNCAALVLPGVLFCDTDCRDDYEKRKRAEARRGR